MMSEDIAVYLSVVLLLKPNAYILLLSVTLLVKNMQCEVRVHCLKYILVQ